MNYYKFNIGDYAAATRHLTMLEHGAYRLLLDLYYTSEQPIPLDLKAAARKAGARSKDEILAVETVLQEFFTQTESGWKHSRCEAEIAEYAEGSEDRAKKEANEKERMKRHRERRAQLFDALRERDVVPAWDISMKELQRLHDATCNPPATDLQRVAGVSDNAPATAKPLTTNHKPITNIHSVPNGTGGKPPMTDPDEIIFGYGLALLTNAGTPEKQARSFLGGLRKHHGDAALVNKLRDCARAKPLQPLEWLAAALPPMGAGPKLNAQEALEASNRAIAERFLAEENPYAAV